MISYLALTAIALSAKPAQDNFWWVFLEKGPTQRPKDDGELEKLQATHIENIKRLFSIKKLLTAGPLQDPTQFKRGILILTVDGMKAVKDCFLPDPYVQGRYMTVHAFPIVTRYGAVNLTAIDPNSIVENRLVVFTAGKTKGNTADFVAQDDYVKKGSADMALYAASKNSDPIRAVALFRGKDDASLKAWIGASPLVSKGIFEATVYPQWLAKGVLDPVKG